MKLQLIRSATLRLEYAGRNFLIDPYLAAKHTMPSYAGKSPNPLVDLKCSPAEAVAGVEVAIISHLHSDHFEPVAERLLPKDLPLLCQPEDEARLRAKGFVNAIPVHQRLAWSGIDITRTAGEHGSGEVLKQMGGVSGFLLRAKSEPTVYWAGDTILCRAVLDTIDKYRPEIIVAHCCGAVWGDGVSIVMDATQAAELCRAAPDSTVIATHMDALDHALVTRETLRRYADANAISPEQLLIPEDMEQYTFR